MAQRRKAMLGHTLHKNWEESQDAPGSSVSPLKLPQLTERKPSTSSTGSHRPRKNRSIQASMPQLQMFDDPPPTPRKVDVETLATFEVMEKLRDRGQIPSGFYEDDKLKLQAVLDQEYLDAVEAREKFYASVAQAKNENVRVATELRKLRRQHDEEEAFLKKNPHFSAWIDNMHKGTCAKHFSLANSKLAGVRYILKAMPPTCPLRILDLHNCNIGDDVGTTIGFMLKTNRCLESLDISENHIASLALCSIAEALEVNDSLKGLNLSHNPLTAGGEDGIEHLVRALQTNQTLVHLNVLNSGFRHLEMHLLAGAMQANHHILVLDIPTSAMRLEDSKVIADAIQRNRSLKKRHEAARRERLLAERKAEVERLKREEAEARHKENLRWIEMQRRDRVTERKSFFAEARRKQLAEAEARRLAREEELARALLEANKKKKGKKKKKKK